MSRTVGWQKRASVLSHRSKLWVETAADSGWSYYPFQVLVRKARLLDLVGDWQGAERILRQNLERLARISAWPEAIEASQSLGGHLHKKGRYDEAVALFEEALAQSLDRDDKRLAAESQAGLAIISMRRGDYPRARDLYNQAREIFQSLGERKKLGRIFNNLGIIAENQGEYRTALDYYQKKMELDLETGNQQSLSGLYNNIGVCLLHQGLLEMAEDNFRRALAINVRIGDKRNEAVTLSNIGIVHRSRHLPQQALAAYQRAQAIYLELGDRRGQSIATNNLGNIHQAMGQNDLALECYQQALAIAQELGDPKQTGLYSINIGGVRQNLGNHEDALRWYDRAIGLFQDLRLNYYLTGGLLYKIALLLELKEWEAAAEMFPQAREAGQRANNQEQLFTLDLLQARLDSRRDPGRAETQLHELLSRARNDEQRADVLYQLCQLTGEQGHRDRASQLYRELHQRTGTRRFLEAAEELEKGRPEPRQA